jgi:hypothetical protein
MGAAYSQHWRDEKLLLTQSVLETARDHEWAGKIQTGLKEMGRSNEDRIDLAGIGTVDGCCEHTDEL